MARKPTGGKPGRPPYPKWGFTGHWRSGGPDFEVTYKSVGKIVCSDKGFKNFLLDNEGLLIRYDNVPVTVDRRDPMSVWAFANRFMEITFQWGEVPIMDHQRKMDYLSRPISFRSGPRPKFVVVGKND